jgi:hypothetical protein
VKELSSIATPALPKTSLVNRYAELSAIQHILSCGPIGETLSAQLEEVDLQAGLNIAPGDRKPDLRKARTTLAAHDHITAVLSAREHLLAAHLLRSLTPEIIEASVRHHEQRAAIALGNPPADLRSAYA